MLTILYPHLLKHVRDLPIGMMTIADGHGSYLMIIKGVKEGLLTAKLKQRIRLYLAPYQHNGSTIYGLVTTFEDDDYNPLMMVTPLLDDEMSESILHLLCADSFNIHFFDDNNRELLGYKAQNSNYMEFRENRSQYKFGKPSLELARKLMDGVYAWFMRRTAKDDEKALKICFIEPLFDEDLVFLDAVPIDNMLRDGDGASHSMLVRDEPGEFQEMDIARLLKRVFKEDLIFLNPLRTDNNKEFVDVLIASAGYIFLVQAKDSPNNEKSINRTLERKIKTISGALDKAIDQTRGSFRYLRSGDNLKVHVNGGIIHIETKQAQIRSLIITQELFESEHQSYADRVLSLAKEVKAPCLVLGYAELNEWTMKLKDQAKFFEAYDAVVGAGLEDGIFPKLSFHN